MAMRSSSVILRPGESGPTPARREGLRLAATFMDGSMPEPGAAACAPGTLAAPGTPMLLGRLNEKRVGMSSVAFCGCCACCCAAVWLMDMARPKPPGPAGEPTEVRVCRRPATPGCACRGDPVPESGPSRMGGRLKGSTRSLRPAMDTKDDLCRSSSFSRRRASGSSQSSRCRLRLLSAWFRWTLAPSGEGFDPVVLPVSEGLMGFISPPPPPAPCDMEAWENSCTMGTSSMVTRGRTPAAPPVASIMLLFFMLGLLALAAKLGRDTAGRPIVTPSSRQRSRAADACSTACWTSVVSCASLASSAASRGARAAAPLLPASEPEPCRASFSTATILWFSLSVTSIRACAISSTLDPRLSTWVFRPSTLDMTSASGRCI
mmetsp:Transcript_35137/g.78211  ORF Transcript_35137/g.78211 Transcript_35137/m.78211 type:complete len:377 (-) Transcript_35137:89-1219(-)